MAELPTLINDLAYILISAGIVTLIFKRLKQPLVLGYIVAGFLVGPHMPYTASVVDTESIHLWADMGVMFLMFSLGLDFSFKKILKMGASPIIATTTIIFCMAMLGVFAGRMFGWGKMDCIFLGGMLAMSSTTIIYKAFDDLGLRQQQFAGLVMSVLILEDILAIIMMVMLSAIASGNQLGGSELVGSVMRIAFFLILWLTVGIFAIPWFLRKTGSILAETIEAERIEKLVEPVKNLFGAIFFVSVGMLVDIGILMEYALPILALVLTIIIGQSVFGTIAFMLGGESLKSAMRCGFSMAQIGEFSFIIASLGLSLGVISDFLYPVVVAVSVITTFLTPYMIRLATPAYNSLEHRLPNKVIKLLNHFSMSHPSTKEQSKWKKLLTQMTINTVIYSILSTAVITVMFTFVLPVLRKILPTWELHWYANAITGVLTILFIAPFLRAMVMKKNHSEEWKALWAESNINHLPLLFTILVRVVIAVNFIFYICNYLSRFSSAVMITIGIIVVLLIVVSRSIKQRSIRLERLFILNLRSRDIAAQVHGKKRPLYEGKLLDRDVHIAVFDIPMDTQWMGSSLKQLNLGKKYGIHITSILRANHRLNIPDGEYVLFPGDKLEVIGSDEQLAKFQQAVESEIFGEDKNLEAREMKLRQMIIGSDSQLIGKSLMESRIRDKYSCMVIGLEEGKENLSHFSPQRKFQEGDIVWVVGEEEALGALFADQG